MSDQPLRDAHEEICEEWQLICNDSLCRCAMIRIVQERERARVVDALTRDITTLREWPFTLESMEHYATPKRYIMVDRADVLAVVEAASREGIS